MTRYSYIIAPFLMASLLASAQQNTAKWDSSKYIRVSEIKKEMPAYCLSVLEGDKTDKYELKILSIVKNETPKRDRILVVGLDERFKHLGSIHGCSGSPVFIDGRMAGALSAGWDGSIDPLYLVTPIEDMLEIGADPNAVGVPADKTGLTYVVGTGLIDLKAIGSQTEQALSDLNLAGTQLPLATNFSPKTCEALSGPLKMAGLVPLQAESASDIVGKAAFEPGGILSVPLCSGDIRMAVIGTVTEVVNDKIYGFGHPFTGIGQVKLPIAAGVVHTVIATRLTSFKFASAGEVLGTLEYDQDSGVAGIIGPKPPMIDLDVKIKRFDDPQERTLQCKIAVNRQLTPLILRAAIVGAGLFRGDLPPEHSVAYRCNMILDNGQTLSYGNLTSQQAVTEPAMLTMSLASAMMNNAFEQITPQKVSLELEITPDNLAVGLWEVKLAEPILRPGQTAQVAVVVKGFRSELKQYQINLAIPDDCPDGKYQLLLCGADAYQAFQTKAAPQKFMAVDAKSLMEALKRILSIRNDTLYACLAIEPSGVSIRNQELPGLPASKIMMIADGRRVVPVAPFQKVIVNDVKTGVVISGQAAVEITIDRNK